MNAISADQLVQLIHDSPSRIVLAASGGGARAIADLLQVPGASRTLLEAVVPYSSGAMIDWLGDRPDEFCSAATARAMAMAAFSRARRLDDSPENVAGIACTASLASDRPKRGPHRIHAAVQTADETAVWHLQLLKDRRSREEEERLAGRMVLGSIADACGLAERLDLELLEGEQVDESRAIADAQHRALMLGETESLRLGTDVGSPDSPLKKSVLENSGATAGLSSSVFPENANCTAGQASSGTPFQQAAKLVFPGSFNPLHAGHRRMFEIARDMLKLPGVAELSIVNVDKPPLDYLEIERRVSQFPPEWTVYLTRAARFEEKSRLFAGATFIVGADTLRRIASPCYHGDDAKACRQSHERLAAAGAKFLVFCRLTDGKLLRLADIEMSDALKSICREVPPDVFRDDISSTELRKSVDK